MKVNANNNYRVRYVRFLCRSHVLYLDHKNQVLRLRFPQTTHSQLSTGSLRSQCHEISSCLVSGKSLLSSWWTAPSISLGSKVAFITWIEVPPSQIGTRSRSNLRVQSSDNHCRLPRLPLMKVRSILSLEVSRELTYDNGYIQRQPLWYLQIRYSPLCVKSII